MDYIDKHSWKCLLGKQSKNIVDNNGICSWEVGKNRNITIYRDLCENDAALLQTLSPFHFYYFDSSNIAFLNTIGKVNKAKSTSIEIDISDLSYKGRKNHGIRHSINKAKSYNIAIKNELDNISDLENMINRWKNTSGDKYFQDHSGKANYYYGNNNHVDQINIFCYIANELVSFGTLSKSDNNKCSYIFGKALCLDYPGLSEFTDNELYKIAQEKGIRYVNMGQAERGLVFYKMKFNGKKIINYHGKFAYGK